MVTRIQIHPKVEKLLCQMESLEKAPSIAAQRARTIIQSLVEGAPLSFAGRLSRRKDARIENLFKFDLGSGYRLICIKDKACIHILYVGSHDKCDSWLDKHSRKKPHKSDVCAKVYLVESSESDDFSDPLADDPQKDDSPIQVIPQDILKKVFRGLADQC